jgi:hypothetical protein
VVFAVVASTGACLALRPSQRELGEPTLVAAIVAQLLLPLVLMPHITFPRLKPAAWYLIIQIASFSGGAMAPFGSVLESESLAAAAAWLMPLSPLMGVLTDESQPELTPVPVDVLSVLVAVAAVTVTVVQALQAIRRTMKIARGVAAPVPSAGGSARVAVPADERVASL